MPELAINAPRISLVFMGILANSAADHLRVPALMQNTTVCDPCLLLKLTYRNYSLREFNPSPRTRRVVSSVGRPRRLRTDTGRS